MTTIYEENYNLLNQLLGMDLHAYASGEKRNLKLYAAGYMDLTVECIGMNELSMVHYFKMNGDLVQDPEMVVLIHPEMSMVEALSFQDINVYQEVYVDSERTQVYTRRKQEQNLFLNFWLKNLKGQGFLPPSSP
jgi:uncharacterized protein YqiB (DUF1249 family)